MMINFPTSSLSGQLGLGSHDSFTTPQKVCLPPSFLTDGHRVSSVCCGSDCSLLLTSSGRLLAAGNNRLERGGKGREREREREGGREGEREMHNGLSWKAAVFITLSDAISLLWIVMLPW